jgi:hypothetical protein
MWLVVGLLVFLWVSYSCILHILPSLKRNEFVDDTCSDSSSNGCGWLLDCLSSCGFHIVASCIFLWMNDDSDISYVGGKFLHLSFMCLTDHILVK